MIQLNTIFYSKQKQAQTKSCKGERQGKLMKVIDIKQWREIPEEPKKNPVRVEGGCGGGEESDKFYQLPKCYSENKAFEVFCLQNNGRNCEGPSKWAQVCPHSLPCRNGPLQCLQARTKRACSWVRLHLDWTQMTLAFSEVTSVSSPREEKSKISPE